MKNKSYKYDEIKQTFYDWLNQNSEWLNENGLIERIHHQTFNSEHNFVYHFYIKGRNQAIEWLGNKVFDVIETIKKYEKSNFDKVITDFSEPEKVANMYAYIIWEQVIYEWQQEQ